MKTKAEKTRQFIIEKTAPIFNTKGYAATSLSDITEATGLTKGSVYGNFENKDEVVIEAFRYNVKQLQKNMSAAIDASDNAYDKLCNCVEFYRENWEQMVLTGGCAMLNAATEADDHLLFLKDPVRYHFEGWQIRISQVIEEGKKEKLFRDVDAKEYAYLMIMIIEGGILISKTFQNKKYLNIALDRVLKIIKEEIKA